MKAVLTLATCLLLVACSKQADAPSTQAQQAPVTAAPVGEKSALTHSADGMTYINDFLGLQIDKPEGWYAQPPEETLKLSQRGSEVMVAENQSLKAMLAASLKSSLPLFGFFQVPPGTPNRDATSLIGMAENISGLPGIKSGCDYLSHVRQMLKSGAPHLTVRDGCSTRTIGGSTLGVIEATASAADRKVTQHYLACVKGEHAIGLVSSSMDAQGAAQLDAVLQTLKVQCQ